MNRGGSSPVLSVLASFLLVVWVLPAQGQDPPTEVERLRDSVERLQKRVDELEKGQQDQVQKQDEKANEEKQEITNKGQSSD